MATLVHDDVLDAAPLRRGHPTVWRTDGRGLATATGDYLFARAFAELTATGDMPAVAILADACLGLARGEILQRASGRRPERHRRRLPASDARSRPAACSRRRRGWAPASRSCPQTTRRRWAASPRRWAWPSRSPTTCSTATATRTPPASRSAPTCWTAPSRCRCCWPPAVTREVAAVIARGAVPDDVLPTLARVVEKRRRGRGPRRGAAAGRAGHGRAGRRQRSGRHRGAARGRAACLRPQRVGRRRSR